MTSAFVRVSLAAVLFLVAPGCKSVQSFDPPLSSENDVMTFQVEKIRIKDRGARGSDFLAWTVITNKTNKQLVFVKDNYSAKAGDKTLTGYVGHGIKLQRGFIVDPNASKVVKFAFPGIDAAASSATIHVRNVRSGDQTYAISIDVPIQQTAPK